jgi:DNA-binding NarL/FixJ family response regulator
MLVDDHAVVRAGYKRFIELDPELLVVAEASTGEAAYTMLESMRIDVVIMDLSMPGQGGFETLRRMLNRFPQQKILIFTMHENASVANQVLQLGARGFLTKSMAPELIVKAIHDVLSGKIPIAETIADALKGLNENRMPHLALMPREFEIFIRLANGDSIEQISDSLHLSMKTAANYQASIRRKMGANSTLDLYQYAREHGLLSVS